MYHIVSEYIAQTTGAKLLHVPYKGATPMMQDLVGQQIDVTILPNLGASTQLLESHKIKAIDVLDTQRMRTLPGVPAITERQARAEEELVYVGLAGGHGQGAACRPTAQRILLAASQKAIAVARDDQGAGAVRRRGR